MQAKRLQNAIIKRGGTATIAEREYTPGSYELSGELNGHDIHMYLSPPWNAEGEVSPRDMRNSYYTVRAIHKRGTHDWAADYNPGGWTFCHRIADLDWSAR